MIGVPHPRSPPAVTPDPPPPPDPAGDTRGGARFPLFRHDDFDPESLLAAKGTTTISVCLPARDEASTIGPIVAAIRTELVDRVPLVDELLVIDDHSTDDTAALARAAGATVVPAGEVLPDHGRNPGKGEALWKSLFVSSGDVVVWCDADIRNFDTRFVLGVLGPLLTRGDIGFVKGFYRRPLRDDGEGGGRVTELMARPLISALFPHLGDLVQPLSGEFGGRRRHLERVPFQQGYGVDLGLLIDLTARFGSELVAQVDLGSRVHRNRPLRELGPQAAAILAMALRRVAGEAEVGDELVLRRPDGHVHLGVGQRPPLIELTEYRRRHGID
jgi:glucosyl-3-phosphoglycerate synthase